MTAVRVSVPATEQFRYNRYIDLKLQNNQKMVQFVTCEAQIPLGLSCHVSA